MFSFFLNKIPIGWEGKPVWWISFFRNSWNRLKWKFFLDFLRRCSKKNSERQSTPEAADVWRRIRKLFRRSFSLGFDEFLRKKPSVQNFDSIFVENFRTRKTTLFRRDERQRQKTSRRNENREKFVSAFRVRHFFFAFYQSNWLQRSVASTSKSVLSRRSF